MNNMTFDIETYLTQMQIEILQLRAVVSALYRPTRTQSPLFHRYEALLDQKATDYMLLRSALNSTL